MLRPRRLPWMFLPWIALLAFACCETEPAEEEAQGPAKVDTSVPSGAQCTVLAEIPGPEDFVVQKGTGYRADRLLVSSQDRRSGAEGAIYAVMLRGRARGLTRELALKGRGDCSFRPHGIYLRQDLPVEREGKSDAKDLLYVINHHDDPRDFSADRSCVPAGVGSGGRHTSIEVFEVDHGSLRMVQRIDHPTMLETANDLVVDRDGTVYVTVPPSSPLKQLWESTWGREDSEIVRFRPNETHDRWSVLAHLAGYTNGIELAGEGGGVLIVSASMEGRVYRVPTDQVDQRHLAPILELADERMPDNFTLHQGKLLLAVHTERRRFLQHARNENAASGSEVLLLSEDFSRATTILVDDGKLLSGASTAACVDGKLMVGQVFGPSVLSCEVSACEGPDSKDTPQTAVEEES